MFSKCISKCICFAHSFENVSLNIFVLHTFKCKLANHIYLLKFNSKIYFKFILECIRKYIFRHIQPYEPSLFYSNLIYIYVERYTESVCLLSLKNLAKNTHSLNHTLLSLNNHWIIFKYKFHQLYTKVNMKLLSDRIWKSI